MTIPGLQLGAPGVYPAPELPDRLLRPVRLDVAGFVGVAPRGPVDTPTLVRSWSDYRLRFGAFEGPGRLPYAVSVFFDQGGERAYVVRVGRPGPQPTAETDDARARLELDVAAQDEPVRFVAANPGVWGNSLSVRLEFDATPQFPLRPLPVSVAPPAAVMELILPAGLSIPPRSLLRIRGTGMPALGGFRWVDRIEQREERPGRRVRVAVLDQPVPYVGPQAAALVAGLVTGTLVVEDGDREFPRSERIAGLGLDPEHPDRIARVVGRDSLLVRPIGDWTKRRLLPPDPLLTPVRSQRAHGGWDIDEVIDGSSFFDQRPGVDLDDELNLDPDVALTYEESPARLRGATGAASVAEVGLLAVPDLFWSWLDVKRPPDVEPTPGRPGFGDCAPPPLSVGYPPRVEAILLDAQTPADYAEILRRQEMLVDLAERHFRFVALLDVPQHLDVRGIARWRAGFDSSYAAAYHPWLGVVPSAARTDAPAPGMELVPPSAFATAIVAARERQLGLPWGPANELAAGAVVATAAVSDVEHDVLHPLGINVFRAERDGFRLTAARTLSLNAYVRQLSVRRLLTMLRLALDRQMQWVVFEPSTPALRELLRHTLLTFLRGLYRLGAFAGASEEEAFFVRVDDGLNPTSSLDLGRLVIEVGVAPAEPIEFIVLRITRDGDGGVRVEERPVDG